MQKQLQILEIIKLMYNRIHRKQSFHLTSRNFFLIICIVNICLFQKGFTNLISINDGFYLPQIVFQHNILFSQNQSITKFQVNGQILSALIKNQSQNKIINYDAVSFNQNSTNILSNFIKFPSFFNNSGIQDFQIPSYGQDIFILLNQQQSTSTSNQILQIDAKTSQYQSNFSYNLQNNTDNNGKVLKQLKFTQKTIYISRYQEQVNISDINDNITSNGNTNAYDILNSNNNDSSTNIAQIYRFDRQNNFSLIEIIETSLSGIIHMQVCECSNVVYEILVVWNSTSFIEAYNCSISCHQIFYLNSNLTSEVTNKILFNGCNEIIVQYDDAKPITVYSFLGYPTRTRPADKKILTMSYLDSLGKYLAVFYENNSIIINQLFSYQQIKYTYVGQFDNFTSLNSLSTIYRSTEKLYIPSNNKIEVYSIQCPNQTYKYLSGLCKICDYKCKTCNKTNGNCIICYDSYVLNGTTCIQKQDQYYYNQIIMSSIVLNSFEALAPVAQKIFFILKVAPISWLFLSFINYWTLCSLYLLTDIKIPDYFTDCLTKIYNAVSTSIFQQLGINVQFNFLNSTQKIIDPKLLQFNISSDVISSNGQDFILIGFIFVLITILWHLKKSQLFKQHWIYKWLSFDRFLIMLGQYVPLICSLLLPASYIFRSMRSFDFRDKINTILSIFLIMFSFLIPFLLFVHFQILKRKALRKQKLRKNQVQIKKQNIIKQKDQKRKLKDKQIEIKLQQYNWLYNTFVNISISILISYKVTVLFLILNFLIFAYGIYIQTIKKKIFFQPCRCRCKCTIENIKKYNNLIQPFHIFLFHLGFIGMYIFENKSTFMYHHMSLFSLFFLLFGALHQLVIVFMESFFDLFVFLRKKCRTKIQPEETDVKQLKENYQHNQQNLQLQCQNLFEDSSNKNQMIVLAKKFTIKKRQSYQLQMQIEIVKPELKRQKLKKKTKIKIRNCPSTENNELQININQIIKRDSQKKISQYVQFKKQPLKIQNNQKDTEFIQSQKEDGSLQQSPNLNVIGEQIEQQNFN